MILPLAEAAASFNLSDLAAGGSALLNTSATLWFFWHTNTVTLPTQQKEFREALERKDAAHAIECEKLRSGFTDQLKEAKLEREAMLFEIKSNREAFDKWKS